MFIDSLWLVVSDDHLIYIEAHTGFIAVDTVCPTKAQKNKDH